MTFGRVTVDDDDSRSSCVSGCDLSVEDRRRSLLQPSARTVRRPRRHRRRRGSWSDVSDVADSGELNDRRKHHHEACHLTAAVTTYLLRYEQGDNPGRKIMVRRCPL